MEYLGWLTSEAYLEQWYTSKLEFFAEILVAESKKLQLKYFTGF